MRPSSDAIRRGGGGPAALWAQGISGDLPIVLLRIDDVEDIAIARQLLRAHEYWRMKQLAVDLVILNERATSYLQELQFALETQLRMSQSQPPIGAGHTRGSVFLLRTDLISEETRARLSSVARVVLAGPRGNLADQLDRLRAPAAPATRRPAEQPAARGARRLPRRCDLEFFNGLGGFAAGGREYVTLLGPGQPTPAPWINVIANPAFGFQVAAEGGGFTWALNSRENQTDAVVERSGQRIARARRCTCATRRAVSCGDRRRRRSGIRARTTPPGTGRDIAGSSTPRTASTWSCWCTCRWTIPSRSRA